MATKVSYLDKNRKPVSTIIGSREAAERFAKTVKNAVLTDVDTAAPEVHVKTCPPGTAEAQKAATNAFYAPIKAARHGTVVRETAPETAEQNAELMMEHFSQARLAGQPMEDTYADWDDAKIRSRS